MPLSSRVARWRPECYGGRRFPTHKWEENRKAKQLMKRLHGQVAERKLSWIRRVIRWFWK
jgi:hypothetical protein